MNSDCSNLSYLRNLKEQVKKPFLYVVLAIFGEVKAQAKLSAYKVRTRKNLIDVDIEKKILDRWKLFLLAKVGHICLRLWRGSVIERQKHKQIIRLKSTHYFLYPKS